LITLPLLGFFAAVEDITFVKKTLLGTAFGAVALAASALSASAAIICSGPSCWQVREAYSYPREAGVVVHPDNWRWGPNEHFTWREQEGRGYWRGDKWIAW
jgi:hypothetical protein